MSTRLRRVYADGLTDVEYSYVRMSSIFAVSDVEAGMSCIRRLVRCDGQQRNVVTEGIRI
jgi:hypothetical protein